MRPKWRVTPNVSIKEAPTNVQLQGRIAVVNLREFKITCIILINVLYWIFSLCHCRNLQFQFSPPGVSLGLQWWLWFCSYSNLSLHKAGDIFTGVKNGESPHDVLLQPVPVLHNLFLSDTWANINNALCFNSSFRLKDLSKTTPCKQNWDIPHAIVQYICESGVWCRIR